MANTQYVTPQNKGSLQGGKKDPWDYESKSTHCTQQKPGAQRTCSPASICWRQEPTALLRQAFASVRLAILWPDNRRQTHFTPQWLNRVLSALQCISPPLLCVEKEGRGESGREVDDFALKRHFRTASL